MINLSQVSDTVSLFSPGLISTHRNERDLAVSPDGKEIMYTLNTPDNRLRTIVMIKLEEGKVTQKTIAPFSGEYADIEPFYAPDGRRLYFSSSRPLHEKDSTADYNIWYAEKTGDHWNAQAKPLGEVINTEADEYYPSVGSGGNLYFTAAYPSAKGREDIFMSPYQNGSYGTPVSLDTNINSVRYEFNAYVSPAEDVIVFTSYGRPDDIGGGDLYVSTKDAAGRWTKARHMRAGINSPQIDYCPFIDFNTSTFYFTSNRPATINGTYNLSEFEEIADGILNGMGNVYAVSLQQLGL
jgi:Tol biopolymer transport system component